MQRSLLPLPHVVLHLLSLLILVAGTPASEAATIQVNAAGTGDATVKGSLFRANDADGTGASNHGGGGVHVDFGSTATFDACTFADNTAALKGGGLYLSGSSGASTMMTNCTLVGNGAPTGGGVLFSQVTTATQVLNCIVAFGTEGGAMTCENGAQPIVSCSDVFGNIGGDSACGDDPVDNFSADPLFCFAESGDYTLQWASPCLPANSGGCGLVGRRSFGACNAVSVDEMSWGRLKGGYRNQAPGSR